VIWCRQFPESGHQGRTGRPPPQQNRPFLLDYGDLYRDVARRSLALFNWKLVLAARPAPLAKPRHRTQQAAWRSRQANRSAQIPRPRIVAQPAPVNEDLAFPCLRKIVHVRKLFQEALVIRNHGLRARLLEHDFGNQDAVGIIRPAPRQLAPLTPVPIHERGYKRGGWNKTLAVLPSINHGPTFRRNRYSST